ncbi:MAG: ral secretion pathway protein [Polaromonas sp.]|nr:ral secretion pathway protein [Polaromonas sp.]
MRMSAAGIKNIARMQAPAGGLSVSYAMRRKWKHKGGFTLIELLIVVTIMAIATAGVGLALRDTSSTALEREAQRLAVLLESARAQSRMNGSPARWRPTATGFSFEGLPAGSAFPSTWLSPEVRAAGANIVVLGPEPVIGPQRIRLFSTSDPSRNLTLATDGVRPFSVVAESVPAPGRP